MDITSEVFHKAINSKNVENLKNYLRDLLVAVPIFYGEINIKGEKIEGIIIKNCSLYFNVEITDIKHNLIFDDVTFLSEINIENVEGTYTIFKDSHIKTIDIQSIGDLGLRIYNTDINIIKVSNSQIKSISILDSNIDETLLKDSNIRMLYIEKTTCDLINLNEINFGAEGIIFKSLKNDRLVITGTEIEDLYFLESSEIRLLSIHNSFIRKIIFKYVKLESLYLLNIFNLEELIITKKTSIENIHFSKSDIARLVINNYCVLGQFIIEQKTNIGLIRITENNTVEGFSILSDSQIFNFLIYRSNTIDYITCDEDGLVGDFDIYDSIIKFLTLNKQKSSFNIYNATIGALKLFECCVNTLNIQSGCKIECYIHESKINKLNFQQTSLTKDSLFSFSSTKIYAIVMEHLSVIGNLYFRELNILNLPFSDQWSDINKYSFRPSKESRDYSFDIEVYEMKKNILNYLNPIVENSSLWIITKSIDTHNNLESLLNNNYFQERIVNENLKKLIEQLKDAYLEDKKWYESNLIRMIAENAKNLDSVEKENYKYNLAMINFIWDVFHKIQTYDLRIQNINKPLFRMYQSSLGKTEFCDSNLDGFQFQYKGSNFIDTIFLNSTIPQKQLEILKNETEVYKNERDIFYYQQESDFYTQIKKVYEKQGNIYVSGIFQSKWANVQETLLLLNLNKSENYLKSDFGVVRFFKSLKILKHENYSETSQDLFTFTLNRISNSHGENWIRAIVFTFVASFFIYILYFLSLNYQLIDNISDFKGWQFDNTFSFKNLFRYYPEFINPARRVDFITGNKDLKLDPSAWSGFWDLLGRIVSGFGIYQLVVAFRKNGKK